MAVMTVRPGQDAKGRFVKGHKLAKGRPWGARSKPIKAPPVPVMRRFHDILTGINNDLGGYTMLSTGERQLARRAALISMHCELMEQRAPLDAAALATYGTLTAHLCKALKMIGLKRVPRDMTPTLQSYLEAAQAHGEGLTIEGEAGGEE
jgi:hypothetical protein